MVSAILLRTRTAESDVIMGKSQVRTVTVSAVKDLTPQFRRLELSGSSLRSFPWDSAGGYIKLRLRDAAGNEVLRTYTVASTDPEREVIAIDFVMHSASGPAIDFARSARIGSSIDISGPGPAKPLDPASDWFLVAGDLSAVPAIRANVAALPSGARGSILLELPPGAEAPEIRAPSAFTISSHTRARGARGAACMVEAISGTTSLEGKPFAWVAGELSSVLKARDYIRNSMGLARSQCYISSYWQEGVDSDAHKRAKKDSLQP